MHAQLSSAQLYRAQQRSAAPCGAVGVPCLALRCGAVSCYAVLYFEHTAVPGTNRRPMYQVPVCTCCVLFFLLFLHYISLCPHVSLPPCKLHPCCQSGRDTANNRTAQHRASCSAQVALGIINSMFAPNHGPLLSATFTCFSCILPCANVAGGAEPCAFFRTTQSTTRY